MEILYECFSLFQITICSGPFEHYLEYEYSGIKVDDIKKKIAEKKILYDYFSDTKDVYKGYKEKKFEKLEKLDLKYLPNYISKNKDKFSEWID